MSGSDTISDAVIGGTGEGAIGDAIHASKRKKNNRKSAFSSPTPPGVCSNCETELNGPVCHSCGQMADTYHRPVWELATEIVDGLLGLEGRLWRTLPPLMLRPGFLTRRYLSGVRARYVMPFRLYLTASVLFFLVFFSVNKFDGATMDPALTGEGEPMSEAQAEETIDQVREGLEGSGLPDAERERIEAFVARTVEGASEDAQAADDGETGPDDEAGASEPMTEELRRNARRALVPEDFPDDPDPENEDDLVDQTGLPIEARRALADRTDSIIDDGGAGLVRAMQRWAPRLMFGMLPIYALMLAITHFYKRGYFFYDHLVVSLHFHSFLFFAFLLMIPVSGLIGVGWPVLILFLWSNFYLYRIHRRVYSHGRFSSVMRTLLLDFVYGICLSIGFLVLFIIGVVNA